MSRQVCETCDWFVTGGFVGEDGKLGVDVGDVASMRRLVRCKECRHSYEHHDARGRWLLCNLQLYYEVNPDGFCAWGETEEGDA